MIEEKTIRKIRGMCLDLRDKLDEFPEDELPEEIFDFFYEEIDDMLFYLQCLERS